MHTSDHDHPRAHTFLWWVSAHGTSNPATAGLPSCDVGALLLRRVCRVQLLQTTGALVWFWECPGHREAAKCMRRQCVVGTGVVRGPPFLHATCLYPSPTQRTGGSLHTLGPTAAAEEKRDNLKEAFVN